MQCAKKFPDVCVSALSLEIACHMKYPCVCVCVHVHVCEWKGGGVQGEREKDTNVCLDYVPPPSVVSAFPDSKREKWVCVCDHIPSSLSITSPSSHPPTR